MSTTVTKQHVDVQSDRPHRLDVVRTPDGREYLVANRYEAGTNEIRLALRSERTMHTMYPRLRSIQRAINEDGWEVVCKGIDDL